LQQRLEEYKEQQSSGAKMNEDQLSALSKYEEVLRTLELSRELEKQFVCLANDVNLFLFLLTSHFLFFFLILFYSLSKFYYF
jgi:hypothetical protein